MGVEVGPEPYIQEGDGISQDMQEGDGITQDIQEGDGTKTTGDPGVGVEVGTVPLADLGPAEEEDKDIVLRPT